MEGGEDALAIRGRAAGGKCGDEARAVAVKNGGEKSCLAAPRVCLKQSTWQRALFSACFALEAARARVVRGEVVARLLLWRCCRCGAPGAAAGREKE